jgi:hypothetical protein
MRTARIDSPRLRLLAGVVIAVAAYLTILAGPAPAKTIYDYVYSNQFTSGGGSNGFFTSTVDRLAFDQVNQQLLVLDNKTANTDTLSKYSATGAPSNFSGLAGLNHIAVGELGNGNRLAVDNSETATQGNIYVASQTQATVQGFAPSGLPLAGFPIALSGICGVAVDPQGYVWVSNSTPTLHKYLPDGTDTGETITIELAAFIQVCPFDFDSNGNIYVGRFGGQQFVYKTSPTGKEIFQVTSLQQQIQTTVVDRSDDSLLTSRTGSLNVEHFDENGSLLTNIGGVATAPPAPFAYPGVQQPRGVAVNESNHDIWIVSRRNRGGVGPFHVDKFTRSAPIIVPTVAAVAPTTTATTATLRGTVDPDGVDTTDCYFEWGITETYGNSIECAQGKVITAASGNTNVSATLTNLEAGSKLFFRVVAKNASNRPMSAKGIFRVQDDPALTSRGARFVSSDTAVLGARVEPRGGEVSYHFEWGPDNTYGNRIPEVGETTLPSLKEPAELSHTIEGLVPGTTYHVRLVVESKDLAGNVVSTIDTGDLVFTTFPSDKSVDVCQNLLVRKQTGAGKLGRCRAFELVSASDTNGYDVESNIVAGQEPLGAYPQADGRVLYTVHHGTIPGSGNPPNLGGDPYVATRGADGWKTDYVGMQADGSPSLLPFASTLLGADANLGVFAFGGPKVCDPCFEDGSINIPLRHAGGELTKGMVGSEGSTADPAGSIAKPFSADGNHLVFGTTTRLEPAGNSGSLSIYDRNLATNTTQVVSTTPAGTPMPGVGTEQLDISEDGSRILIGRLVGTDSAGNKAYDLYMHVGTDPKSVLVADTANGVSYAGMSSDGTDVYFTTADPLADDADAGADLFRAVVGPTSAAVSRVSTGSGGTGNVNGCNPVANADGNNWNAVGLASTDGCGVAAIAGGGGVAQDDGTVAFLSPEKLDGGSNGTLDEPNLYLAEPGGPPKFVATLEPDNPLVRHAVSASEERDSADFQVTPDGTFAVFSSDRELTGYANAGYVQIFRFEQGGGLDCISCTPTNAFPANDTELTSGALNLTDDGRVFFTTSEQLVLPDTNRLKDVYEWDEGAEYLVSTGLDTNDSGLFTASADGTDVFFFTRQVIAPQDENGGSMKIYDARENGGFLFNPPPRDCAASDECHGPSSTVPPPPPISTYEGTEEAQPPVASNQQKRCKKGFVRKRGKCVKRPKRKHHRTRRASR